MIPGLCRRRVLRLLAAAGAAGLTKAATAAAPESHQAEVDALEAYLNDLTTMRATFTQVAANGEVSTGRLYYQRPDEMRLEYDPPKEILIVASGWQVVYVDKELDQTTGLFTSQTPLGFLLDDEIRLSGEVTVEEVQASPEEIAVSVVETDDPEQGQVTLVFAREPIVLRRWAVTDAQGLTTLIVLERAEFGVPLDEDLFDLPSRRRVRDY